MFDGGSQIRREDGPHSRPFWAPPIPDLMDMDALCHEAVSDYRAVFARSNEDHPWTRLSDEEFLMRLNAAWRPSGSLQVYPSDAGILMFGYEHEIAKLYPEYLLDYRKESKNGSITKRIVSNDGLWSGCLFDFWTQVSPLLAEATTERSSQRKANDATLSAAAKEGLANALVHSDYAGRRHLVVVQRADRIEYSNPGGLRVRASVAMEGGVSDPRNPYLMKMFALIGACTDSGRGLHMISLASEKAGVFEPVLSQQSSPDRTHLTVFMPSSAGKREEAAPSAPSKSISSEPAPSASSSAHIEPSALAAAPEWKEEVQVMQTAFVPMPGGVGLFEAEERLERPAPAAQSGGAASQAVSSPARTLGESEAAIEHAMGMAADPDARAALSLFRDKKRIKRSDVEELLGVGSTKAKAVVATLVSDGIISAEGGGRSTLYRLTDTGS